MTESLVKIDRFLHIFDNFVSMEVMNAKNDPLSYLYDRISYSKKEVERVVAGMTYTAVVLKSGDTGVCAGADGRGKQYILSEDEIDLYNLQHRLYLNAYYCAIMNQKERPYFESDIFDAIDFRKYDSIVMIGYFKPLVQKLTRDAIRLTIFDDNKDDVLLSPMSEQMDYVLEADCLIVTATTMMNFTFRQIYMNKNDNCDLFLLGPSGILDRGLMNQFAVKHVFSMVFEKHDQELLEIIESGGGLQQFKHRGQKVYI